MSVRFGQDDSSIGAEESRTFNSRCSVEICTSNSGEKLQQVPRYGKTCCFTRLPLATLLHQLKGCYAVVPRIGSQAAMLAYFLQ
jgi:hypothetical protein